MVRPILWSGVKTVGRETLRTGSKILSDMADNSAGMPSGDIVSKRAQEVIVKLKGGWRKRKAMTVATGVVPKKVKRAAKKSSRTTPKRTYRDIFA